MCGNFSNSQWIYGVRDFVAPQTMFAVFFVVINVHVTLYNIRYSKSGIPDQTDGISTLFQTKMAKSLPYFRLEMLENGTLWGGTLPIWFIYGSTPGVTWVDRVNRLLLCMAYWSFSVMYSDLIIMILLCWILQSQFLGFPGWDQSINQPECMIPLEVAWY